MDEKKQSILKVIAERLDKVDKDGLEIAAAYIEGMAANEEKHKRMQEAEKATA